MTDERAERIERALGFRTRDVCLVIDRLDKAHNYMAVLRTADALGIQDVHIVPLSTDSDDAISRKVTQGAHKWLTIHMHADWRSCFKALRAEGYKIYASMLSDSSGPIESMDLSGKLALLFGNELQGLEPEEAAAADGAFILPMFGFSQSFNVSVACALTLQLVMQQRDAIGVGRGRLSESEMQDIRQEWYVKAIDNSKAILAEARRRSKPY